jgi:hypothetical protein
MLVDLDDTHTIEAIMAKEELAALNKGLDDIPPVPEGDSEFDEVSRYKEMILI